VVCEVCFFHVITVFRLKLLMFEGLEQLLSEVLFLYSREKNLISIWNNGQGIPVVEHKDEKMYVPTMIFGHLLTSSNYNDEEEKVTGGRNGYGAKLCNIFSTMFTVETAAKEYKRSFKQVNICIIFLN